MYSSYNNKPKPIDLHILKECGYNIGDSVFIRPNSSDWSGDWRNVELMVVAINWNSNSKRGWSFTCIPEDESDVLHDLDMDDLTRYNFWE